MKEIPAIPCRPTVSDHPGRQALGSRHQRGDGVLGELGRLLPRLVLKLGDVRA